MVVFVVDGFLNHGGLTDRFNGIISTYAICKAKNLNFRIKWDYPFPLQDYLNTNEYDWRLQNSDIFALNRHSKSVIVLNDPKSEALFSLSRDKQYHVYANSNIIDQVNRRYKKKYVWSDLFNELFKPGEELSEELSFHTSRFKRDYIGVVFRFQQLLGDFKEGNYKVLPDNLRESLINKCVTETLKIRDSKKIYDVLVTSDSLTYLARINNEKNIYTIPGKVVHITFSEHEEKKVYLKSFVDLYMLSKTQKVYSVITKEMTIDGHLFLTTFPEYAAKIGKVEFERVYLL